MESPNALLLEQIRLELVRIGKILEDVLRHTSECTQAQYIAIAKGKCDGLKDLIRIRQTTEMRSKGDEHIR